MGADVSKVKRKWCYTQKPSVYCIGPCDCGNSELEWSEWEKHVWCAKCELDFIPKDNGVFDGPIPLGLSNMLGIRFDRIDLETMTLIKQEDYLEKND